MRSRLLQLVLPRDPKSRPVIVRVTQIEPTRRADTECCCARHPSGLVTVVNTQWHGSAALELTYKTTDGKVANELLYRDDELRIAAVQEGRPWSFDGDGALFRLVSEAQRIRLAHLFDPVLAIHTSDVEPLPHQITAVYETMLQRQPLRFLLADDPGAGKTIMAGLLMKELIARGDLQRCLVVCPGSLAEQWQDELFRRFHLPFDILTNDKLEAARTGNWFLETNPVIARLDKLSRNDDVQLKLQAPDCRWDLIVCDEAHKMSATFFGGEIKHTKRYKLGQLLSTLTRHFLLMTRLGHPSSFSLVFGGDVNDIAQIVLSVVSSGFVAAGVTGFLNMRADERRDRRDDNALRRQVRAAAHSLAIRVVMARQFGFTNVSSLMSSLAYLDEISKDRAIEKALSDRGSRALHEAVDLCRTFIEFSRNQGIDPESTLSDWSPDGREKKQSLFSHAAKPTFDKLRELFADVGATDIVAEFDQAERGRTELERIRLGFD